ncbi:MAG TPA: SLC13 family permease, partial [Dehalococcoidia bacterium]|nr:SLC13 family permease [Dehalococcoidia bacterium]
MPISVVAALIFTATYVVLAAGRLPYVRIDRTGAAVVGAILMIATGVLPLADAYAAIDYRTIVLLFGMMILIASLRLARFFRILAASIVRRVQSPAALIAATVFASGILSALFVNDTICLAFTPILIDVAEARAMRPLPLLLALATGANVGSVATITGNPQNMLIASLSRVGYVPFARALAPVALVGLAIDAGVLVWMFRRDLHAAAPPPRRAAGRAIHRRLMIKSTAVAAAMLCGFLAGFEPALVAALGAAVLLVSRGVNPRKLYDGVDWDLLMLFIGLFVVVAGVERAGIDRRLFAWLAPAGVGTMAGLAAVTAVAANVISNVPAVMLFTKLIPHLPDPRAAWLTLAMASTLAGNLTVLGSIANLIVVEGARRRGVTISFADYLRA